MSTHASPLLGRAGALSLPLVTLAALAAIGAPELAAQTAPFAVPLLKVGAQPESLAAGDLDNDGDVDVVVGLMNDTIVVALSTGPGTYAYAPPVIAGAGLARMALGDLNGDGVLDLAYTLDSVSDFLVVRLGSGTGTFGGVLLSTPSAGPHDVDLADLDGDGRLDAVVPCVVSQRVAVFKGNGDGTFAPKVEYLAGSQPLRVAVGDWSGDTLPDLAIADNSMTAGQRAVTLLANNGAGGFKAPVTIPMAEQVYDVEFGDFDADGAGDLAVSQAVTAAVLVLFGDGAGGLLPAQPVPALGSARFLDVADVDEDGHDDIALVNAGGGSTLAGVLRGLDGKAFAPLATFGTFGGPRDILVADASNDGDADLLVPCTEFVFGQSVTVLEGNGRGSFRSNAGIAGDNCQDVAFGDFDGDGWNDLVAGSMLNDLVTVSRGAGAGFFETPQKLSVNSFAGQGARAPAVAIGDLDGDGNADIAVGANKVPPELDLFFGDGALGFEPFIAIPLAAVPGDVAAIDLDDDQDLDLLATGHVNNTLAIVRNLGGGSFAEPDLYATANGPYRLDVADMDGDRVLDVVVTTGGFTGSNFVHVFLGNGDGTVQDALSFPGGSNHGGLALGDADGDEDVDVAVSLAQSTGALLLSNDGNGFLSAPAPLATPVSSQSGLVLADLDRDGITDLAVAGSSMQPFTGLGGVSFLRGAGLGVFEPAVVVEASSLAGNLIADDIDGDGALDLAVPSIADYVQLLLNRNGPWNDLGHPLAGTLGLPKQVGEGTLQNFAPFRFTLSDSRPSSAVAHFVGLGALNAPFKAGVLVPVPQLVNFPLLTDAAGDLVLEGPWPAGAGGLTLYFQFWFQDPQGPVGFASSNALSATIPAP